MSDPYQNDPYRNDPNRRVYIENEAGSGMGTLFGIVVVALLIVGGIVFYNANHGTNIASNETPTVTTTSPPLANPARPMPPSPIPATPPATTAPSDQQ